MKKIVSIIVPVYNVEKFIFKTVNSILNQDYKNIEIILVDDGSPDNSARIIDELAKKDNRIVCVHKENGGVSSARNAGLKIATGEYVTFIDGDDWVEPNYVSPGGHSIADSGVKYGLSVTGLVDPHRMYTNDTGMPGDKLVLTKALGVGLLCTANRVGEAAPEEIEAAIRSMTTLNKTAAELSRKYHVHAATDVTGFSFLGHLHEMMGGKLSCIIHANAVPVLPGAEKAANAFLYTAAGQRNRNHTGPFVRFENVSFAMEEVLFDPQTSGGLLLAVDPADAAALEQELRAAGLPASIVGEILPKQEIEITVIDK